jgi:glycosyl transferase family 25
MRGQKLADGCFLCVSFGRLKGTGAYVVDRLAAGMMVKGLLPMRVPWDHAVDREWPLGLRACSVFPFPVSQTDSPFRSSVQGGKARKLSTVRRWATAYPYQVMNEISRWWCRGNQFVRLRRRTSLD